MTLTVESPVTNPVEEVTPLRASEAMRLGCLETHQITRKSYDDEGGACALGAMMIGYGGFESSGYDDAIVQMVRAEVSSPCGHALAYSSPTLDSVIIHLNDKDGWSREMIASWLESIGW